MPSKAESQPPGIGGRESNGTLVANSWEQMVPRSPMAAT